MTLLEMKKKVLRLIEEINPESEYLTDDIDIKEKINDIINQIMFELCRIKKIPAYDTLQVKKDEQIELQEEFKNFYQLESIKDVQHEVFRNLVIFKEDGIARIFYYKYPRRIDQDTKEDYKFELTDDSLEIMPYRNCSRHSKKRCIESIWKYLCK